MNNTQKYLATIALLITALTFGILTGKTLAPVQEVEVVKYVEVQSEQMFDTSIIEQEWCGDFTDGTIRMVGAWWYTDGVVEDEQGQLWAVEQAVSVEDWLCLWIADNHTPNDTRDDIIIKVWREVY
jgi:hypothetical protein